MPKPPEAALADTIESAGVSTPEASRPLGAVRRLPWQSIGRWWAAGLSFYVIGMALLYVVQDVLHLPLLLGSLVTAELILLARFFVNDRWVFQCSDPAWKRLWQYHIASFGGSAIWWCATNVFAVLGLHYLLASTAGTACSVFFSMLTNFLWIWRKKR